jgi:hypothetical protein
MAECMGATKESPETIYKISILKVNFQSSPNLVMIKSRRVSECHKHVKQKTSTALKRNPYRFNNLWFNRVNVSVIARFGFIQNRLLSTGLPCFFISQAWINPLKLKGKPFISARYASSPKQSKQVKTVATVV